MVQKAAHNSPSASRRPTNNTNNSNSPLRNVLQQQQQQQQQQQSPRRNREASIVSDLDSIKSFPVSVAETSSSDVSSCAESGYETITDVVCKGPLLYYKPRWFGESWRTYDAVLTTDGVFRWYKKGSDQTELEGTLVLKTIPNGLITIGSSTENIPKEQQVRFPRDYSFRPAIAIGEPYVTGEIFWFLCPSLDMIRLWEQGFRDIVAAEKFSSGHAVFSAWKKYSPERPSQTPSEPHKEGWNGVEAAVVLALDFAM